MTKEFLGSSRIPTLPWGGVGGRGGNQNCQGELHKICKGSGLIIHGYNYKKIKKLQFKTLMYAHDRKISENIQCSSFPRKTLFFSAKSLLRNINENHILS